MSKYIDAEKLIAEIERLTNQKNKQLKRFNDESYTCSVASSIGCGLGGNLEVLSIIKSLQQEQPECSSSLVDVDAVREDFITEVYRVLDADPTNDRTNAIINAFDSLPTVSQEQPEVDLKMEEIAETLGNVWVKTPEEVQNDMIKFAHHFYELGRLNARKEN